MAFIGGQNSTHYGTHHVPQMVGRMLTFYPDAPKMNWLLMSAIGPKAKETINDWEFSWEARTEDFEVLKLLAPLALAPTKGVEQTIQVDHAERYQAKDVLQVVSTGEEMWVVNMTGPNTLVVRRGFGNGPALAAPAGSEILKTGTAFEEFSMRPAARGKDGFRFYNRTQIFRNAYGISGTLAQMMKNKANQQSKLIATLSDAVSEHFMDIERAILWGSGVQSAHNGQPIRKTDGVVALIQRYAHQNIMRMPSILTIDQFSQHMENLFRVVTDMNAPNVRTIYTGSQGMRFFQKMGEALGVRQTTGNETSFSYGNYRSFDVNGMNFELKKHPFFDHVPGMSNMWMIIDPATLTLYVLGDRDMKPDMWNSKDSLGIDGEGEGILTECGLGMSNPFANAYVEGACEVACDTCLPKQVTYNAILACDTPCSVATLAGGEPVNWTITGGAPGATVTMVSNIPGSETFVVTLDVLGTFAGTFLAPAVPQQYMMSMVSSSAAQMGFQSPHFTICVGKPVLVAVQGTVLGQPAVNATITPTVPLQQGITQQEVADKTLTIDPHNIHNHNNH